MKEGDWVLIPEYGGTKVQLQEEELVLYREDDIIGLLDEKVESSWRWWWCDDGNGNRNGEALTLWVLFLYFRKILLVKAF